MTNGTDEDHTRTLGIRNMVNPLPLWILIISGLFALIELMVGILLFISPQTMLETIDFTPKDTFFLAQMWAGRQLALGVILAYATFKKSIPMLTISYIFLLVMFLADLLAGVMQNDNSLIMAALAMSLVAAAMLFVLNRRNK